jgi:hypothetical protein
VDACRNAKTGQEVSISGGDAAGESIAMTDEPDAGAAYLAALKQSSAPQARGAATASAPAPTSADKVPRTARTRLAGAIAPGSADKRRSPRYRFQGSAQLRESATGVTTWTNFTDIGLYGCYVEAAATHRVGVVLGLKLEANGFRVEATGEVSAAYPNLGMGISFTKMTEENREHLRELVRSISRPSVILGAGDAMPAPSTLRPEGSPQVANPGAALQAMVNFFEDRHMMGREEFLRILRKSE